VNLFAVIGTLFILFCAYRLIRIISRKEIMIMHRWFGYHWEPVDGRTGQYAYQLIMSTLLLGMGFLVVWAWTSSGDAKWF
jgi:hypothetical protein